MSVPRIRALVVDDDPRLVDSMSKRIGREINWDVDWVPATDVDEGRGLITSSNAPFDVVIADLMFPRDDFPDQYEPRRPLRHSRHPSASGPPEHFVALSHLCVTLRPAGAVQSF